MSDKNWTKGPWNIDKYGALVDDQGETIRIRACIAMLMSLSAPIGDEARSNAFLVSAVTELYDALEAYLNADEMGARDAETVARLAIIARKAMSKANGGNYE